MAAPCRRTSTSKQLLTSAASYWADVVGYGFTGGGTLSLRALDIQIGGTGAGAREALNLRPDFFANQASRTTALSAGWDVDIPTGSS